MFNLEDEINKWKKSLRKNPSLEDGYAEELESHLRDKIEDYTNKGMSKEEAFEKAKDEIGDAKKIGAEFFKTDTTNKISGRSTLNKSHGIYPLLPNFFKIVFRTIKRNPGYSLINISGLAVGIASCLLIFMYVLNELNFDMFNKKADRIYRIVETRHVPGQAPQKYGYTMGPLAPALMKNYPGIEYSVRLANVLTTGRLTIEKGNRRYYEGDFLWAENSFFNVFDYQLIEGDKKTALINPKSVILTESSAHKYFDNEDPLGKTLKIGKMGNFIITGILKGPPSNSHLDFSMLLSFSTIINRKAEGWKPFIHWWGSWGFTTYLVLNKHVSPDIIEKDINDLISKNLPANSPTIRKAYLQPLKDIHFGSSDIEFELNAGEKNFESIYILSAIALLILLIASINYINLSTARATIRAKEVGLRKVVGARPFDLLTQFLNESIFITVISSVLSLLIIWLALPYFNQVSGKDLTLSSLLNWNYLLIIFGIIITIGLFSGFYPAFYLSRFKPSQVLKSNSTKVKGGFKLRNGLVVAQFVLSIVMIVATIVVNKQLEYVNNKKLGFNKEHLVIIDINNGDVRRNFRSVKNEFEKYASVSSVSVSSRIPGDWKDITEIEISPENKNSELTTANYIGIDKDFLNTFKSKLKSGRNFSQFHDDSTSVLLNETAARLFGNTSSRIELHAKNSDKIVNARVIGIVKDFNFKSLHQKIGPLVLGYYNNPFRGIDYFSVRISGKNIPATLKYLKNVDEHFDPEHPAEYHFLDQQLELTYKDEQRTEKIFGIAAIIAIIIASMGMFALSMYTVERRIKEIGIRKVLGATAGDIIKLLLKKFLKLILLAFIISIPLSWYIMNQWLKDFAYRIGMNPWIFIIAGLFTLITTIITISWQSVRTALMNPVNSIRNE